MVHRRWLDAARADGPERRHRPGQAPDSEVETRKESEGSWVRTLTVEAPDSEVATRKGRGAQALTGVRLGRVLEDDAGARLLVVPRRHGPPLTRRAVG